MADTKSNNLESPCGLYCGECLYYKKQCQGCVPSKAQPSWAHAELTLAPWKRMLSIAANALNFHVVGSLINIAETWDAGEFFYKARQLISRKKIGTTSWVEEKSSGKNSDRKCLWSVIFSGKNAEERTEIQETKK